MRLAACRRQPAAHRCKAAHDVQTARNDLRFVSHARVVHMVHVQAMTHQLPAQIDTGLGQGGIARRHRRVDGHAGWDVARAQLLHDAVNAHPVAVVAQGVVAQIRVGGLQRTDRLEGHALLVQGKPLQRCRDPQGHPGAAGPLHRRAVGQHRPVVTVVVHAVLALGVAQIVLGDHGASPTGTEACSKAL